MVEMEDKDKVEAYSRRIRDTGNSAMEGRIDRTAKRMMAAKSEGDTARYESCKNNLVSLCYRYFIITGGDVRCGVDDLFNDVIVRCIEKFDSSKGLFTHLVRSSYKYAKLGLAKKQEKEDEHREKTSDYANDDGKVKERDIEDFSIRAEFEAIEENSEEAEKKAAQLLVQLLSLVTDFRNNIADERRERQRQLTPLFFTETVVRMTKDQPDEEECAPLTQNETALFKTMEVPFLDTFMQEICRTIIAIYLSAFKEGVPYQNRIEAAQDGNAQYAPWQLPASFYKEYVAQAWGRTISDAIVSQQRAHYESLVSKLR